jgi:hypothetical protein
MHMILKSGEYTQGDRLPEGAIEVPFKPREIETTWDGKQWVETEDSKAKKYQRDRLEEYPSIQELVVALYDEEDKQKIVERRTAVKAKYPKPE